MRRREFIAGLGAASWPLAVSAQEPARARRIGVLINIAENDPQSRIRIAAFLQGLRELGWDGSNLQIDYRWGAGNDELIHKYAAELIGLAPDVILAVASPIVAALQKASSTVPIVFVGVIDPVGGGFVASLSRPGRNATGFGLFEYSVGTKWLQLLKQIAPRVTRVGVIRDLTIAAGSGQLGALQAAAAFVQVEASPIDAVDEREMERVITAFAQAPNGGLIVTASTFTTVHRAMIISLAAKHRLPATYPFRLFVPAGGLIAYGPDLVEPYRLAAGYVHRILNGEKTADLPVQTPIKYELAVNLKTANALGLEVPPTLLALADEIIA